MDLYIGQLLEYLPISLIILFTAAMPIIELKGAIPIGISLGLSPLLSASISFLGSIIPVPFILFGLRPIFAYLQKFRYFNKFIKYITKKSLSKGGKVQKYGAWGLFLFVAIPLPGTGVWTGSLIATLLNIRFKWAFIAIFLGNLIACLMIVGLSGGIFKIIYWNFSKICSKYVIIQIELAC